MLKDKIADALESLNYREREIINTRSKKSGASSRSRASACARSKPRLFGSFSIPFGRASSKDSWRGLASDDRCPLHPTHNFHGGPFAAPRLY